MPQATELAHPNYWVPPSTSREGMNYKERNPQDGRKIPSARTKTQGRQLNKYWHLHTIYFLKGSIQPSGFPVSSSPLPLTSQRGSDVCGLFPRTPYCLPEPKSVPHTSLVLGSLSYEGVSTSDSKASTNSCFFCLFCFFFNKKKFPSKSVTAPFRFTHAT